MLAGVPADSAAWRAVRPEEPESGTEMPRMSADFGHAFAGKCVMSADRAFHRLYPNIRAADIPFAQDQVGDQFLIRDGAVVRLAAESGDVEPLASSIEDFFQKVTEDIEGFLDSQAKKKLRQRPSNKASHSTSPGPP